MDGRDHNNQGFSVWLAGGGVKGGTIVGATDHYGYRAVENKKTVYKLHATILHLLGLDYQKLTYRFNGRDMQLTDVHGTRMLYTRVYGILVRGGVSCPVPPRSS